MLRTGRFDYLGFGRPAAGGRPAAETAAPPETGSDEAPDWLTAFVGRLGGARESGPGGPQLVVRRRHAGREDRAGGWPAELPAAPLRSLGWLGRDPALGEVAPERIAFLDCETTGLSGGTGTKVFLVGIACLDVAGGAPGLRVEQHFLADYDAEGAFLAGVDAALARFGALATFNGKSFDLPLLEARLALARRRADWLDLPHLDLLHPARRVWRRRLESCSLAALEERILGRSREDDVPGWLIPSLYFSFLRTGDLSPLAPVFEHNRRDLLSLATLTLLLARLLAGDAEPEHALDWLSLARLLAEVGEVERGIACCERALALDLGAAEREEALGWLGLTWKRLRHDERAVGAWEAIAERAGGRSVIALVELAKHYEHRARDCGRAAELTRRALLALTLRPESAGGGEASVEALEHRLRRLEARLSRSRGPAAARRSAPEEPATPA